MHIIKETQFVSSFDDHKSCPYGYTMLPLCLAEMTVEVECMLMDCNVAFNALFGRDCTTAMRV